MPESTGPIRQHFPKPAVGDDLLIDVSEIAAELGFTSPVFVTPSVWAEAITPGKDVQESVGSRLRELLWLAYVSREGPDRDFVICTRFVELTSVPGIGDDGKPVLTVTMPDESEREGEELEKEEKEEV